MKREAMQALEYTVDGDGSVRSKGTYRVISAQEWDSARDLPSTRYAPYDAMLRDLAEGQMLAIPCGNRVRANHVRTLLHRKGRAYGFVVQVRVVGGLDGKEGIHLLARREVK